MARSVPHKRSHSSCFRSSVSLVGTPRVGCSFCAVMQEQSGNLSTEQKGVLAKKEKEIKALQVASKGSTKGATRRMSVWQQKLDQAQLEQLAKK